MINSTQFNISGSFLMPSNGIFKLNKTSTSYKDLGLTPPPCKLYPPPPQERLEVQYNNLPTTVKLTVAVSPTPALFTGKQE